ncbi:GGDEF domain-containing protein [Haloimpatiens sp. FM7315]|uniref:GGDEF domain-containing protein n=1 Tax=Haloimpatiens sp. FM7315 TaxID=3298609 RepID=UPI003977D9C5
MNYNNMDKETLIKIIKEKDEVIESLNKKIDEILHYANVDEVTKVLNRRSGLNVLNTKLEFCRINNESLTLCFIDIDNFKKINDSFGHGEGDKVLQEVSKIFKECIRNTDSVLRMGGDEFIIGFENINKKSACKIWNRICSRIHEIYGKENSEHKVTLSRGFSEYNKENQLPLKDLIEIADKDMYENKKVIYHKK